MEQKRPIQIFNDHGADVMSLSVSKPDPNLFVSGSCDSLAMVSERVSECSYIGVSRTRRLIDQIVFSP